jgi:type I restriction enzyme, S subunit
MFRQQSMRQALEEMGKGTAQSNLSPVEMSNMAMQVPPSDLLEKFNVETTPVLKKVYTNKIQIKTLEQLRDTLLPKLMSGEVRVEV